MANADSRAFEPPPGWRYVVMPAAPNTHDTHKLERRRLAENVICLHGQDREPVANVRWRGRYPRNVVRRYGWGDWGRLHPGDYCMIWNGAEGKGWRNQGRIVQLIERKRLSVDEWYVRAINQPIHTHWVGDPDNPEGHRESWECLVRGRELRRCASPLNGIQS